MTSRRCVVISKKVWNDEEINIIKEYYGKIPNKELINRFPGRTKKQLVAKAKELGLCQKEKFVHNFSELVGQAFGQWFVDDINYELSKERGMRYYNCTCRCGIKKPVSKLSLKNGSSTSCGHEHKSLEVGDVIGDFEILEIIKEGSSTAWKCICRCVYGENHTRSYKYLLEYRYTNDVRCNCYKKNKYELINDYYAVTTYKGEKFYIDKEDYDVVSQYQWFVTEHGYISATSNHMYLHRLVMNFPENMQIDHKNGNRLDCRKQNLRICDNQRNSYNTALRKNNKSGIKGVYYSTSNKSWNVQITYEGKVMHVGYFKNKIDAINKRLEIEKELFKDYSYYERENVDVDEAIKNAI